MCVFLQVCEADCRVCVYVQGWRCCGKVSGLICPICDTLTDCPGKGTPGTDQPALRLSSSNVLQTLEPAFPRAERETEASKRPISTSTAWLLSSSSTSGCFHKTPIPQRSVLPAADSRVTPLHLCLHTELQLKLNISVASDETGFINDFSSDGFKETTFKYGSCEAVKL